MDVTFINQNIYTGPPIPLDVVMKVLSGRKGLIRNFQMAHRGLSGSRIMSTHSHPYSLLKLHIPYTQQWLYPNHVSNKK